MSNIGLLEVGGVSVQTTSNRGSTPAEVAQRCADRIVSISDSAPPEIQQQARAYKGQLQIVVEHYMRVAIRSDRSTIEMALVRAGHPELAEMIRSL